ncbi:MAG TPA: MFS transporter [Thermoplasmata archaeon]|nr:MFS transporter [Thermoplasmata archaeon]
MTDPTRSGIRPGNGVRTGPATTASPTLSPRASALVLTGVFLAILMGAMDGLVVSTVLPTIASSLHQVNGAPFVVGGYLIASTLAIPIFARLSDISSRRNVFLVGLVIFIVGSALAGLSQTLGELIAFRSMQGFGGGAVFPVAIAMVALLYPPQVRAKVIGALTGAAGVAIVAGPLLGSYIVSVTTWRWVFYINLPFGLFGFVIIWAVVGPLRPESRGSFDLPGAVLLSSWVAALMLPLVQISEDGWTWTDPATLALLITAVALFFTFLFWELRHPQPLVPLRMLGERVVGSSSAIMLFLGVVFSGSLTFLSLYVGLVLGGSAAEIRDVIYFFAIPMIVGAALSGPLLDRVSYRAMVAPGLLVSGLAALALGTVTASTPLWRLAYGFVPVGGLVLPLIPVGFGLGLALAGATVAVQNEAPPAEIGAAVGLTRFFQSLGGAIGISLLTIYQTDRFRQLSSGAAIPSALRNALAGSYADVFLAAAFLVLAAFLSALWLRGRLLPKREPQESGPLAPVPDRQAERPGRRPRNPTTAGSRRADRTR